MPHTHRIKVGTQIRARPWWWLTAVGVATLLALLPGFASAQEPSDNEAPRLQVGMPQEASLGDVVAIEARLTTADGAPIAGAQITFLSPVQLSEEVQGEMEIGVAKTDASGVAVLDYQMRRSGNVEIRARFNGDPTYAAQGAQAFVSVTGEKQLYTPEVGLNVPWLGPWLVALVIAAIWGMYLFVATRVFAIARSGAAMAAPAVAPIPRSGFRSRRQFLERFMVPAGMHVAIGALGTGLIAVVARSPYTHAHLKTYTWRSRYNRTPFVMVGQETPMRPLGAILKREVSFSREVLPIFRAKGGPHAHLPENSPAPGGIRLDSYEAIMQKENLVVPGEPEKSELVAVLVAEGMHMPPAGNPLSDEELQLIVSWVAQGAKDT